MTKTYKIAQEIAHKSMRGQKEKDEALRERDFESDEKFNELEENLDYALESFGYEAVLVYEKGSPMIYCDGEIAFKVIGASISRIEEEN